MSSLDEARDNTAAKSATPLRLRWRSVRDGDLPCCCSALVATEKGPAVASDGGDAVHGSKQARAYLDVATRQGLEFCLSKGES